MFSDRKDPVVVAEHLFQVISPPSDCAVSISTFSRPGKSMAIKVFILPQYRYLESRVPTTLDGFEILREIASMPTAS